MIKNLFLHLLSLFWLIHICAAPAVTYEFSGGRFGDNLLSYLHAKWVSFYNQIPLIYVPFKYSSELILHEKESQHNQFERFTHAMHLPQLDLSKEVRSSRLYICPYFPEVEWELKRESYPHFSVDWKNAEFRQIVNELIQPTKPIQTIEPPKDTINIAMHIREGGGFDHNLNIEHPLKCPPISFYIDTLLQIIKITNEKKIYCHIFTDASQPSELADRIKKEIPESASIDFNFRNNDNYHDANVLQDFFSFFNFDILIRPQSNFSIIPSLIHDYAIVYSPTSFTKSDLLIKIDEIDISMNSELLDRCKNK